MWLLQNFMPQFEFPPQVSREVTISHELVHSTAWLEVFQPKKYAPSKVFHNFGDRLRDRHEMDPKVSLQCSIP